MPDPSVFFGVSPVQYKARNPRRLGFEPRPEGYDDGRFPACAINGGGQVIEVHMGSSGDTLNFRRATLEGLDLRWRDSPSRPAFGNGNNPAVALGDANVAIVLADQNSQVKWAAAAVDPSANNNPPFTFTTFPDPNSTHPSVAVNRAGVVIEVHEGSRGLLYYRRGKLDGTSLSWSAPQTLGSSVQGQRPFVALGNTGKAVLVFQRAGEIHYAVGSFDPARTGIGDAITFGRTAPLGSNGLRPTAALTDEGSVLITYQATGGARRLFQVVGRLDGETIRKLDFLIPNQTDYAYDDGSDAQVATNGKVAVQVFHAGGSTGNQLRANASLIFDRTNWMGDNRTYYRDKTLRRIALPASHDAGAFADNVARTQNLTIRQQLRYGVRYFDIRPKYSGDNGQPLDATKITTYHDITVTSQGPQDFLGPTLVDLVRNIRLFMESHKELVILKISHFKNFNDKVFAKLAEILVGDPQTTTSGLRQWLFTPRTDGQRLADRPLADYLLEARGTVLIVVDKDGANDYVTDERRAQGLFRYRDWYAADPDKGDLTVFDIFSNVTQFDEMALNAGSSGYTDANGQVVPAGQLDKFEYFDGFCQKKVNGKKVPCDLFLLSWTLTPSVPGAAPSGRGTAFARSADANRNLAAYLAIPAFQGANPRSLRMNLLYTDGVEFSRSVDVAMIRNGLDR